MEQKKRVITIIMALILVIVAIAAHYRYDPWSFYWKVSPEETQLRLRMVQTAECYLGYHEADGSHKEILDIYNQHQPLAVGYVVQPTDSWCATFVSATAIQCGFTDIIPTECGCERQIELFRQIGCWEEDDSRIPLPGDLIFYNWNMEKQRENTGWSDHVGIVVGTKWPFVKVIEGNKDDSVSYRTILLGHRHIRGYALPDYRALIN